MNFTRKFVVLAFLAWPLTFLLVVPSVQGAELEKKAELEAQKELLTEPAPSVEPEEPISRDSLDLSYKRVETAQLEIKLGIDYFPLKPDWDFITETGAIGGSIEDVIKNIPPLPIQIKGISRPALNLILQVPILTPTGSLRWLVQAGIGRQSWLMDLEDRDMESYHDYNLCDTAFQDSRKTRLDKGNYLFPEKREEDESEYKQCSAYNKSKRALTESAFWYVPVQTGFQFNLKPFFVSLSVGGFYGLPQQYGGTGEFVVGWNFSDKMSLSAGTEALYYNEKLHWGYSIALGLYGKKWTQRLF